MRIDFNQMEEKTIPGMNGGTGEMTVRMFFDGRAACPAGAPLFRKRGGKSARGSAKIQGASLGFDRSVPRTLRPWTPVFMGARFGRFRLLSAAFTPFFQCL